MNKKIFLTAQSEVKSNIAAMMKTHHCEVAL